MEDNTMKQSSSSCHSVMSDNSREEPPNFRMEERTPPNTEIGRLDANYQEAPQSPTGPVSLRSKSPPPDFSAGDETDRNTFTATTQQAVGTLSKTEKHDLRLPIEDWTKEQVKDWLISQLKVPKEVAQNLYGQELSGACLASFDKQDLRELGVPHAPAIQIIRQVEKLRKHSETLESNKRTSSHDEFTENDLQKSTEMFENMDIFLETETVSSDSGVQSQSPSVQLLQLARNKIKSVIGQKITCDNLPHLETQNDPTPLQLQKPICPIRPFDKHSSTVFYMENDILPPVAGPSNLLDPVHEYQLLPSTNEACEKEILYEFTKEVCSFAASCMNSRTNGTIHFGVNNLQGVQQGLVIGHSISSFTIYQEAFESCLSQYFEERHVDAARMCIRPPDFIQVHCQDGTTSDKWVIEVDVVPNHSETKDNLFYTLLSIQATDTNQQCKTECLFIRDASRSINILADPNPRVVQEKIKDLTNRVEHWVAARKLAEANGDGHPPQGYQGQRLKQLITRGRDVFENSLEIIVVTDRCHSSQLEQMDFLKEMKLFAVLDFDPESDVSGTCNFFRKDHVANLHYPYMYTSQNSLATTIGQLNLFQQTSWIFCNGQVNEENEADKPMPPNEWLKKRSGDISTMVSFLCSPDLVSKDRLLVIFMLHSPVTDISSPILETFCAMYRTLEGLETMLCICKDSTVFSHWKKLVEGRCKEDITSKCIYELSLIEISSTIKKLKEPQTQTSQRFLPSTGSSSVLLAKKDEELYTVLDILCENECENTEIETNEGFQDFKKKTEEDYYRGGQVTWWNFYLSEMAGSLPFIKRDKYNELYDLVSPTNSHTSPCVMITLFHHPGCGGTTLAMHVLWELRRKYRCAVVKNYRATNVEIAAQVMSLLTYGKQDMPSHTPVLLLVDNLEDVEDLRQCIITNGRQRHNSLMVMILNCERTPFPEESSRNACSINVFITNKLSFKEQGLFSEKLQQLRNDHEKPETFYAFMIMTQNFSETYIKNLVSNIVKDLDISTQQGKLFSLLALLNTYVNGSYMSLSLCEELVGIRNVLWKRETLDDKMNPHSTLLITFTVEEHGTYQAVRFLHQMIASHTLQILCQEHALSRSEITINLLICDKVYKSCMGKDFLIQNIQSMLITRQRKEHGDDKDTLFSPLIEDINENEGRDKIKEVLERATVRFDKSATIPQALARHFCLKENDFKSALKWALDAQGKNSNSYISDTVAQVYKSHLKKVIEECEHLTPDILERCLTLASKAVHAFRESQELAKRDESFDNFVFHHNKRKKSYNTSGYVGETEVTMILLDVILQLSISSADNRYKTDKILQVLKGHHTMSSLNEDKDTSMNQFLPVLEHHETFLVSLKPRLKEIFCFFENYFTYLRPRNVSEQKDATEDRYKKKVSKYFKKYIQVFSSSEEEKASEKAKNPKLSLHQELLDQRNYLELKRADSFAGLLQRLSEKNGIEMEHIVQKWNFILDNSPSRYASDTVNFILANIVLHYMKPSSKFLKKYEKLVDLLNEELQNQGTHSKLTELYYLSMLLIWPTDDQKVTSLPTYKNIGTYVTSVKKSFHRRFSHMFPARSAITHFFLGKSSGLKRIVPKVKLDRILDRVSKQDSCSGQSGQPRNLHHVWQSGAAWNEPEVQNQLLRIKGKSENGEIYVNYIGNLKMSVRPVYLGDIRSGCSREDVSFFLGFTMEGPVAYNVKYEKDQ